jgi:hypothetical protein
VNDRPESLEPPTAPADAWQAPTTERPAGHDSLWVHPAFLGLLVALAVTVLIAIGGWVAYAHQRHETQQANARAAAVVHGRGAMPFGGAMRGPLGQLLPRDFGRGYQRFFGMPDRPGAPNAAPMPRGGGSQSLQDMLNEFRRWLQQQQGTTPHGAHPSTTTTTTSTPHGT